MTKRISHLDGWRALAIASVFAAHFGRGLFGWLGDYGVELFFSLSGLLMVEILFVREAAIGPFLIRRVTRVYPALLVFISAMLVASIVGGAMGLIPEKMRLSVPQYVASATFTTNYYYALTGQHSVVGHTWSLGVELTAYLLLALIAGISNRRLSLAVPTLFVLSIVSMITGALLLQHDNFGWESVYWRTDARIASILLPAALFLVLRKRSLPVFVFPVSFILAAMLYWHGGHLIKHTLGTALMALCICSLESTYSGILRFLSSKPVSTLGVMSYSLYLWQQPFWKAAASHAAWITVMGLFCSLGVAWISYRLIEVPARDWLNHRLLKPKSIQSDVRERDLSPR